MTNDTRTSPRFSSLVVATGPTRSAVLGATAMAVVGEFLLQRVFVRVAVHVPALPALRGPYGVLTSLGSTVFNAAAVLVLVALLLSVLAISQRLPVRERAVVLVAVLPFGIAGWSAGLAGMKSGTEPALAALYLIAAAVIGSLLIVRTRAVARVMSVALVVSLLVGALASVPAINSVARDLPLVGVAEASFLLAIALAPLALKRTARFRRSEFGAGIAVAVLVATVQLANSATLNILGLWGLGLTGGLPAPLYWGGAGAFALVTVHLLRQGQTWPTFALLLITLGGVGLHNSYQSSVQLLGLCTLVECVSGSGSLWSSDGAKRLSRASRFSLNRPRRAAGAEF